jgi:hypothetical protein
LIGLGIGNKKNGLRIEIRRLLFSGIKEERILKGYIYLDWPEGYRG